MYSLFWGKGEFCGIFNDKYFWFGPAPLGNRVKRLGSAKVCFVAFPMQNLVRNTTGTLLLMNGGLPVSKLAI